ncbi:helix-turn-helix transcriptional regulator [Nonomuraea africana]
MIGLSLPGLTKRQSEIAVLAAQGLTNREIAERLVVSIRTVANTSTPSTSARASSPGRPLCRRVGGRRGGSALPRAGRRAGGRCGGGVRSSMPRWRMPRRWGSTGVRRRSR